MCVFRRRLANAMAAEGADASHSFRARWARCFASRDAAPCSALQQQIDKRLAQHKVLVKVAGAAEERQLERAGRERQGLAGGGAERPAEEEHRDARRPATDVEKHRLMQSPAVISSSHF